MHFFNISWLSLLFLLILVDTSTFLSLDQSLDSMQLIPIVINFLPCVFFFVVYFSQIGYFSRIERELYPQIKNGQYDYIKPEAINFHENYDIIDPFALFENIPQPNYLAPKDRDEELFAYEKYALSKKKYASVSRGPGKKEYEQDEEESEILYDNSSRMSQASIQLQNIRSLPPGRVNKDRMCLSWDNK